MSPTAERLFLAEEHRIFREQVRRFLSRHVAPHVDQWERDKSFPRELYARVAAAGYLGVGFPEEHGGSGGDLLHKLILVEELCRAGSPGLSAALGSLHIALPPILAAGSAEQKRRWLPAVLRGEQIAALAVTEPGAGSDVAAIAMRARRQGDDYLVTGRKIFITSGTRADLLTCAVRTGGPGPGGISVLVIESDRPGVTVEANLEKMGWHPSDTAALVFEDVRVPAGNLVGEENGGFAVLMQNFAGERLLLAASAVAIAQLAWEQARAYAAERQVFGRPVSAFQVNRHRLAEMATGIEVNRTYVYALARRVAAGEACVTEAAMAKNAAVDMAMGVVDAALQLHGGYGYMRDYLVERLYRDIRLYHIGGGTREVMNELIARQLL